MTAARTARTATATAPDDLSHRLVPGLLAPRERTHLGHVVLQEPEARVHLEVHGQHDPPRRHPAQFGQPRRPVVPVMHRQDGHRHVGRTRRQRQCRAAGPHGRSRTRRTLRHHDARRIDRHHYPVPRLVAPGARPDVHHDAPVPELFVDHRLPARLSPAMGEVALPDGVVDGRRRWRRRRRYARPGAADPRPTLPTQPCPPAQPLRRRLLQNVHAAGRAQPDHVRQPDLGALDLAVAAPHRAGGWPPPTRWRCRWRRSGGPWTPGRRTRSPGSCPSRHVAPDLKKSAAPPRSHSPRLS